MPLTPRVSTPGGFDRITLEKALAGKAAGVLPSIGTFEEGVRGVARVLQIRLREVLREDMGPPGR